MDVRFAGPQDAGGLARLRWQLLTEDAPGFAIETAEKFKGRFSSWAAPALAAGGWRAVCADDAGRLIGSLWLGLGDPFPALNGINEHRAGWVNGVYVEPSYRSQGIGSQMIAKLGEVEECFLLEVWAGNAPRAEAFYRRNGFDEMRSPLTRPRRSR